MTHPQQPRADAEREAHAQFPDLPGHPEPRSFTWTRLEEDAIYRYGRECFQAGRAQALAEVAAAPAVAWRYEARHIDTAWGAAVSFADPGPEGVYMRNVTPLIARPQPDAPTEGGK